MSWTEAMWQAALVIIALSWVSGLARNVIGVIEGKGKKPASLSDVLNSAYPVFSEKDISEAYYEAAEKSRALEELEGRLRIDPKFAESARRHAIPEEIAGQMLRVTEAVIDAEKAWYRHSALLDANMSVLAGQQTRDEALAAAKDRMEHTRDPFNAAMKLRDEWKARLEGKLEGDPPARPYSNPWFELANGRFPW